ncbi:MAG: HigA family addiction module antitoxin [Pseudomonadota bacterium]
MIPLHTGRVLKRELSALELSANKLALALRLQSGRITEILGGKRGVSADTALRLGRYFGNSTRFWLSLQTAYELAVAERDIGDKVAREVETSAA